MGWEVVSESQCVAHAGLELGWSFQVGLILKLIICPVFLSTGIVSMCHKVLLDIFISEIQNLIVLSVPMIFCLITTLCVSCLDVCFASVSWLLASLGFCTNYGLILYKTFTTARLVFLIHNPSYTWYALLYSVSFILSFYVTQAGFEPTVILFQPSEYSNNCAPSCLASPIIFLTPDFCCTIQSRIPHYFCSCIFSFSFFH